MKAIQVKWLGATDTLPSRVKAWTSGGHETIESTSEFHDLSEEEIVRAIAQKHIEKMQLDCVITGVGCLPDNTWAVTISNKIPQKTLNDAKEWLSDRGIEAMVLVGEEGTSLYVSVEDCELRLANSEIEYRAELYGEE